MNDSFIHSESEFRILDQLQSKLISTMLYFSIFEYPLTLNEIFNYSGFSDLAETQNTVASLSHLDLLQTLNGKYFLSGNEQHIFHRETLNKRAATHYSIANRYTRLISKFPFVRGVLITGSLSKGCMERNGDIDYLIITEPNRLWLCRTFLTIYKKLILFNSRKYFCVNYYLDEESLHIPDHNIFTATEIACAKPAYNADMCNRFFASNSWVSKFYPSLKSENLFQVHGEPSSLTKNVIEKIFNGTLGELADTCMMRLFIWRWKNKFKGEDQSRFEVNFRSRRNVSKHHPHGFQFKVLQALELSTLEFQKRFNVKLT